MMIIVNEKGVWNTNMVTHSKRFVIHWVDSGLAIQYNMGQDYP